jgi:hypothetical protein
MSTVFSGCPRMRQGDSSFASLRRHFPEFQTAFRYRCPAFLTIAINMYFRIEPTCVVERASLNKRDTWHHGEVREDWRPTFWTEIPLNWLTTIASVVKGFESSSNRHCRFWNSYQRRESSSRLLLTMCTMAHADEGGIGIRGIPNLAAEAATCHLYHFTLSRLVPVADGRKLRSFSCRLIAERTSIKPHSF